MTQKDFTLPEDEDTIPSHLNGHNNIPVGAGSDRDFLPDKDAKLAGLVDAIFDTKVGRNRKAILTAEQAVLIARARAFAQIADLPEVEELCNFLMDTSVSVKGTGLKQLVEVLSARIRGDDAEKEMMKFRRTMGM